MIVECPGCQSRYDVTGRPPGTRARCRCGTVFPLPEPRREAGGLSCPKCGANVAARAHTCEYCHAALLVKACPRCFARIFHGAKHCAHCGAEVGVPAHVNPEGDATPRTCPRCQQRSELVARLVGDVLLDECTACHGVWLDAAQVERLIEERRQTSTQAVLGMGDGPRAEVGASAPAGRMYIKCPDCDAIMNRVNFARRSGILLDVCRSHGTWFDERELPRVVEFVMKGGVEIAEKAELDRLRERARRERDAARHERSMAGTAIGGARIETEVSIFGGLLGVVGKLIARD